jgi:hypothetical protein
MKSVEELMATYQYQGGCHCDGYETHIWKDFKNNRFFRWRKYKGTFRILQGSRVLLDWFPVQELEAKLKTHETLI